MSTLSDGLAARDKATKGPWCNSDPWITAYDDKILIAAISERSMQIEDGGEQKDANLALISAAPDALDWIAKALPYIKDAFNEAQSQIEALYLEVDGWENSPGYVSVMNGAKKRVAELAPLIAQAEGTEKEGEK